MAILVGAVAGGFEQFEAPDGAWEGVLAGGG